VGLKVLLTRAHGCCPWIDAGDGVLFMIDVMPVGLQTSLTVPIRIQNVVT
jgi:hypothetical protein